MDFYKYHALGNDYAVIDPQKTYIQLHEGNIRMICDRHTGIGADGILYGPFLVEEQISFQVFNPDGSEAETSGNGLRIFARYLINAGYEVASSFTIRTKSGEAAIEVLNEDASLIKVNMGSASFASADVPASGSAREMVNEILDIGGVSYKALCLNIGNPHCVIPVPEATADLARTIGPAVESYPMFPNRINMQLLQVLDRNNIQIEIWERGAGYTLASGSSSCAAASAARKLGLVDDRVTVRMPGGELEVSFDVAGSMFLLGEVASVAEGFFTYEMWSRITAS